MKKKNRQHFVANEIQRMCDTKTIARLTTMQRWWAVMEPRISNDSDINDNDDDDDD